MRNQPASDPRAPRERLLDAATRLFCRHGITATGIDLVVAEAGVAKTTLYKAFGSKERLVEAVLDREGLAWRDWFFAATSVPGQDAAGRLRAVFPALKEWFGRAEFYGCPFINAVGEHDKGEDRLRTITLHHKRLVLDHLSALASEAGCQKPEALAHQIGLLMDGATVAALVTRDCGVADAAGGVVEALLASLVPSVTARRRRHGSETAPSLLAS